jgi:hypothetical protein
MDNSGYVDEFELREFLLKKKKEGVLRKDVDTRVSTLMGKYDPDTTGTIGMTEFMALQTDIIVNKVQDPAATVHEHRIASHRSIAQHRS